MSVFGCHSCGVDLSKFRSYEESPCATCKIGKEYFNTPKAPFYDTSVGDNDDGDENPGHQTRDTSQWEPTIEPEFDEDGNTELYGDSVSLQTLKEVIQHQVLLLLGDSIMRLLRMAKANPVMFEVVIKKMQFPYMSYSEIGLSMNPQITKQNVLYHLKHAIEAFPELGSVFLTDTRFSAGRNALETVANKVRRQQAKEQLGGIIYGDNPRLKAMAMKQINSILHAPFLIPQEILDYNYYGDDEAELRMQRLRARNYEKISKGERVSDEDND